MLLWLSVVIRGRVCCNKPLVTQIFKVSTREKQEACQLRVTSLPNGNCAFLKSQQSRLPWSDKTWASLQCYLICFTLTLCKYSAIRE